MQTLKEIDAQDQARRERAWRYERAQGEVFRLRRDIERLTPLVVTYQATLDVLAKIDTLAAKLPNNVEGTNSYICRDQIRGACLAAKTMQEKKRDKEQRQLAQFTAELPRAEAALKAAS